MEPQRLRFTAASVTRSDIDRSVAILAQEIAAQRYRVTELARQGRDTRHARAALGDLESRIADRIVQRDRAVPFNLANRSVHHA